MGEEKGGRREGGRRGRREEEEEEEEKEEEERRRRRSSKLPPPAPPAVGLALRQTLLVGLLISSASCQIVFPGQEGRSSGLETTTTMPEGTSR